MKRRLLILATAFGLMVSVAGCAARTDGNSDDPDATETYDYTEPEPTPEPTPVNLPPVEKLIRPESGTDWVASLDGTKLYTISYYHGLDGISAPDYSSKAVIALNLATGKETALEDVSGGWVDYAGPSAMVVTDDGKTLIAIGDNGSSGGEYTGQVIKADLTGATTKLPAENSIPITGPDPRGLILSPDNKTAYVGVCGGGEMPLILVIDIDTMKQTGGYDLPQTGREKKPHRCSTGGLAITDDGTTLYAAVSDYPTTWRDQPDTVGAIVAFDTSTGQITATQKLDDVEDDLLLLNGSIYAINGLGLWRFSPDKFNFDTMNYDLIAAEFLGYENRLTTDNKWLYTIGSTNNSQIDFEEYEVLAIPLDAKRDDKPQVYATIQFEGVFTGIFVAGKKLYVTSTSEVVTITLKG